ncbi:MAG: GNAT family N-acetyltransferase [Microbacterium sp.]|nr:GNAT family N-acetyltransferase [Microbacterium sp.]
MLEPMTPHWTIEVRRGPQPRDEGRRVWECYREVFSDAEDFDGWLAGMFDRHARREGHRLVVASVDDEIIGFAWGYVGEFGQYWTDLAASALPEPVSAAWLGGHFEFVELGVRPKLRGAGVGRALHDALLDGVDRRALLSTADDDADPAVQLYLRSGWRRLGALSTGVQVMGRMPH